MKLAFSKPTKGEDEQRLLFGRFAGTGFDGLQLKARQYLPYLDDPAGFADRWGSDPAGVSALIAMGGLDDEGRSRLRSIVAFAAAVGSERVVFCHALSRRGLADSDIAGFAATLSELGREAADRGVALSLHHHFDQPVMHRRDFDVFFDAADREAVHLTVDTAHLVKSGVHDIAGLVADLAPVVDNLHVKDFAGGEFRVLGRGDLDLDPLFQTLATIRYTGWLCADEESRTGLVEGMDASIAYLRSRLCS